MFKKVTVRNKVETIVMFVVLQKIFFLSLFYKDIFDLWRYSKNIFGFYKNSITFFYDYFSTISWLENFLFLTYVVLLYFFCKTFVEATNRSLPLRERIYKGKYGAFGIIFAFLGFGCVSCGQTLIYSFFILLGSTFAPLYSPAIGYFTLLVSILILTLGIKNNLANKKINI